MIKEAFNALGDSARGLFRNWRTLAVVNVLYVALLVTIYLFFRTGVASTWQLVVSALTALVAPVLFFLLQAALAHAAHGDLGPGQLLGRALRDFGKVLLVSLPLAALAVLLIYLLNKLAAGMPQPSGAEQFVPQTQGPPPVPLRGRDVLVSSLWLALLGFVLPLMAARLWLAVARDGLKATLKGAHRVLGRALTPSSVTVYAVGLFVFGLMTYVVIFTRTPVKSAWGELLIFGLRLALAFVFTLWGWAITLGALARLNPEPAAAPSESTAAGELPQQA